ncbi:MAG: hypothetical protein ABI794_07330 [Betaproteobacteria bacterium]
MPGDQIDRDANAPASACVSTIRTVLTCLTGFFIFQHGGFGKPHAGGILTLVAPGIAALAEYTGFFGRRSRYVTAVSYSATVFFT